MPAEKMNKMLTCWRCLNLSCCTCMVIWKTKITAAFHFCTVTLLAHKLLHTVPMSSGACTSYLESIAGNVGSSCELDYSSTQ